MVSEDHLSVLVPATSRRAAWLRRLRRPTTILLVLVVLGAWTWIERGPLLGGAAELWVISDPVGLADAVVILGGGLGNRSFVAAEFYKKGLVNRVLISQVAEDQAIANRDEPGQTESNRYALLNLGVPVNTIETFGKANKNTRDEALALREWAERHPVSDFIIPTENFITRRTRWIFRRVLAGHAGRVAVSSFEPTQYTTKDWWKTAEGFTVFRNEILKYLYYRLKY